MSTSNSILDTIRTNRISTVEVADALNKTGVVPDVQALNTGKFVAAEVYYACTWGESNWPLHEQVQKVPAGRIVYVDAIGCEGRAIFGDIVAKWLMLYQRAVGLVVNGMLRDVHRLRKEDYPIWCTGASPLGCFNKDVPKTPEVASYIERQRQRFEGAILVCDDSGVTMIEKPKQTEDLQQRLDFIELQEDIWYFCIDTLKLSTYDTICRKIYLEQPDLLPPSLRDSLREFLENEQ